MSFRFTSEVLPNPQYQVICREILRVFLSLNVQQALLIDEPEPQKYLLEGRFIHGLVALALLIKWECLPQLHDLLGKSLDQVLARGRAKDLALCVLDVLFLRDV